MILLGDDMWEKSYRSFRGLPNRRHRPLQAYRIVAVVSNPTQLSTATGLPHGVLSNCFQIDLLLGSVLEKTQGGNEDAFWEIRMLVDHVVECGVERST